MLADIREQRDRWQQQAERLAAHPRSLSRGPQPSDGRMTQNRTPLLGPTCLGAQTWAPPSGATTLLILSSGTGTHSPSTLIVRANARSRIRIPSSMFRSNAASVRFADVTNT